MTGSAIEKLGEPSGTRTRDPLIKRRGLAERRPSVFLRRSAQPCAAARVLVARLGAEQDSRRTRGLKSAYFTGAFSANQRKPGNSDPPSQSKRPARRI